MELSSEKNSKNHCGFRKSDYHRIGFTCFHLSNRSLRVQVLPIICVPAPGGAGPLGEMRDEEPSELEVGRCPRHGRWRRRFGDRPVPAG
jgi:hypothetical protein